MSEPFIGQISMFSFKYAPVNWAFAQGQMLQISQYQALFALLGTTYGGDGRASFALPDLAGRMPCGWGRSNSGGMQDLPIGQRGGHAETALNLNTLPQHTHNATFAGEPAAVKAAVDKGENDIPSAGSYLAAGSGKRGAEATIYLDKPGGGGTVALGGVSGGTSGTVTVEPSGLGQSFSTVSPYLALNFSIALLGLFPSRN